eukprot:UN0079
MCLQRKASCLGVWAKGASKRKLCAAACYKHMVSDKINSCIEKDCDASLEQELSGAGCEASGVSDDCQDTRPDHHYSLPSKEFKGGLPAGFQALGGKMTKCELYELQKYCVDAINTFRAGRPFSDGRTRNHGKLPLLKLASSARLQCSNAKALSDLKYSKKKGCGHHTASLTCNLGHGAAAENSCCTRHCSSLEGCKKTVDGCLQSMWDEGKMVLDTGAKWSSKTGHYYNMINKDRKYVSCGFGFDDSGKMLATQQFFWR